MTVTSALLAAATLTVALAAEPAGYRYWSAHELRGFEKTLSAKVDAKKIASQPFGKTGNRGFAISHRQGPGEAEVHATENDIFVVEGGEATLLAGGTVKDPKTTAPGQIRGSGITGAHSQKLSAGDIVHIPAGVPHQLLIEAGRQFTYFVIKVE